MMMMSAEKTIRAQARAVLRGGWMKAIFAMIMVLLGAAFVDCISSVITLIYFELDLDMLWVDVLYYSVIVLVDFTAFFLISPIINGYIRMFYRARQTIFIMLKICSITFKTIITARRYPSTSVLF